MNFVGMLHIVAALSSLAASAHAQSVGTTTGGPLTVAGQPIYGVGENGDLFWYFHRGNRNGAADWANGGQGVKVGSAWNEGLFVFKGSPGGDNGVIYRVDSRGDLYWYRHVGHDTGEQSWAGPKNVGSGWQNARRVFAAGQGVLYMIDRNGDLYWYRHLGYANGASSWANQAGGVKVGSGWNNTRFAIAAGSGVIYLADQKGDLYWYRHIGYAKGSSSWANHAKGVKVGSGWDPASVFSGGDGVIYVMRRDGNLYWYNHTGFANGAATWTAPTGNRIGTGWGGMVRIF